MCKVAWNPNEIQSENIQVGNPWAHCILFTDKAKGCRVREEISLHLEPDQDISPEMIKHS